MPSGTNWEEFLIELESEFKSAVVDEYGNLKRDVVVQAAEVMESLVPRKSGRLARSIAASAGEERKGATGGSAQVRRIMADAAPFENVFLMVNEPYASLVERGTVKATPKPFFRPALESVSNLKR